MFSGHWKETGDTHITLNIPDPSITVEGTYTDTHNDPEQSTCLPMSTVLSIHTVIGAHVYHMYMYAMEYSIGHCF